MTVSDVEVTNVGMGDLAVEQMGIITVEVLSGMFEMTL